MAAPETRHEERPRVGASSVDDASTARTPLLDDVERGQDDDDSDDGHYAEPVVANESNSRFTNWLLDNFSAIVMSTVGTILVTAVLVVIGVAMSDTHTATPKRETCTTPACIHAASEILYNLSPNYQDIDPCTDFEELICGGWADRHDLRPDQGDAFTGTIMSENSQTLLRHILEAPYPDNSEHSSFSPALLARSASSIDQQNFEKLQNGYDACMDEETIKGRGLSPLLDVINQVREKFPVSDGDSGGYSPSKIFDTVLFLSKLGISSVAGFGPGADDKDPDTVVIHAYPPRAIGLPAKDYYEDDSIVKKYEDMLADIISKVHPEAADLAEEYAHLVVGFEKRLAAASPDAADSNDVTKYYNPMSIVEANLLTPQLQLSDIIRSHVPDVRVERIIVQSPSYMKALKETLATTPDGVLQAYFIWKAIQSLSSGVDADELKSLKRFKNELQGKEPDSAPERWRTCVSHVDDGLGWILSRFFVEKAFSAKAKDFGDQIVTDIKTMFIEKIKKTSWMDKDISKLAIDKVHKIAQKIGYPTKSPDIMDPPSLQDYYESVNITSKTFFENIISTTRHDVDHMWSTVGKPVDHDTWEMTVPTVNAYYNPPGNEIVFPAGIMQFPVFSVDLPAYLSYGAFGSVSGHELSHAFDSTGRHYDQNGNFTDWWNNATVEGFETRAECFVDQYGEFTVPGPDSKPLHVNGRLTLGENIADAGGVSAAFAAWQAQRATQPNAHLPGLGDHFTQEQMFFVAYGNWWCGHSRKETAIQRIYTDPHAPKWARILGTMANSRDFRESFQCASKEPVCELW